MVRGKKIATRKQPVKSTLGEASAFTATGPFPIVGIGASAGGLEAFMGLLAHLPNDTGMAFVLLQHLDPKHESMSSEILQRSTKMPVAEVQDGIPAEPNHVHVIPPGFIMEIEQGRLRLIPRGKGKNSPHAIDFFFESMAKDQRNLAIGVVLSGTGHDGTQGLMTIKAEGGITFAQNPQTAKFENMPISAIESGSVDLVLSPEQIAIELGRIAAHPCLQQFSADPNPEPASWENSPSGQQESLNQIFALLKRRCHVDFSLYKSSTVRRRLERRMLLLKITNLKRYADFLLKNSNEAQALFADILIHVTGFFRDPDVFEALKTEVFPKIIENRAAGTPIRIWVPGCSTGEEAYSLAIALLEFLGERVTHLPIQIFATDISEQAIQKARAGEYPALISSTVSTDRLSRFFLKAADGNGYKIAKTIRDVCIFSRHDLIADPPFAKIDLISCRNLLIYFTATLQKQVIPIFHYSLASKGFLLLGTSETIGNWSELFSPIDKLHKVYQRTGAPLALRLRFPASTYVPDKVETIVSSKLEAKIDPNAPFDIQKIADQIVQLEYPGVLVNQNMEILQIRGRPSPFLGLTPGAPSNQLFKMLHSELIRDVRSAFETAKKTNTTTRKHQLSFCEGRALITYNLNVIPVQHPQKLAEQLFLIVFEKTQTENLKKNSKLRSTLRSVNQSSLGKASSVKKTKDFYALELQSELNELREFQRTLAEKYESAQDDLTATNEELQSANEELQSTNEELETAKEELQSGNEELTTVNDELQSRSIDQIQTNNDLINLLGSVEIPIVMLGDDQKVRRFTPLAGKALNLINADLGRPLTDLKLNFHSPTGEINLEKMVADTIETMISQEEEVQDRKGRWFRLQVRPYKTIDNKIDGAVLALVDINDLKISFNEVKAAKGESIKANRAKDLFLATLSHELRTPLTAILSWAQLLKAGKLSDEKARRAIEIIEENGKAQAQLINDLLDISRIVSGKIALETVELMPGEVVLAAVDAVRPTAEAKSIHIETKIATQVGAIMADPMRLQQILWNLLSNAIKFSAPESKVAIEVNQVIDPKNGLAKAVIRIKDSGKGIDAEFLPLLFDRFSQEDNSTVRLHGGLGLGLAIVRDLVHLHGGTIFAESLGLNCGACFSVFLPIISDRNPSQIQNSKKHSATASQNLAEGESLSLAGIRVLLVDDETDSIEAFKEILESFGAEILCASSAKEALLRFAEFRPHVLVSDIAMPGEDGYSLIRKIRALKPTEGGRTSAIAMTAYAAAEDVSLAQAAGFQAHLSKPVDGPVLAKAIFDLKEGY